MEMGSYGVKLAARSPPSMRFATVQSVERVKATHLKFDSSVSSKPCQTFRNDIMASPRGGKPRREDRMPTHVRHMTEIPTSQRKACYLIWNQTILNGLDSLFVTRDKVIHARSKGHFLEFSIAASSPRYVTQTEIETQTADHGNSRP